MKDIVKAVLFSPGACTCMLNAICLEIFWMANVIYAIKWVCWEVDATCNETSDELVSTSYVYALEFRRT